MKKKIRIAVIMAVYNGSSFLIDQIESILKQNLKNYTATMDIFIRDDGSQDTSVDIINSIVVKHDNVHFIEDYNKQLGPKRSFFKLLSYVKDFDIVFFSDQDDLWPQSKVLRYLEAFDKCHAYENNLVTAVYSDAWVSDASGHSTGRKMSELSGWPVQSSKIDYHYLAFSYAVTGATLAINKSMVSLLNQLPFYIINRAYMHDALIASIAASIGELIQIPSPLLFYRQHNHNVVGARQKDKKIVSKIIKFSNQFKNEVIDSAAVLDIVIKDGSGLPKIQYIDCVNFYENINMLIKTRPYSIQRFRKSIDFYDHLGTKKRLLKFLFLLALNFQSGEVSVQ